MSKKAKRQAARERIAKRLAKGKNVNAAKIANKTGISEKKAAKIVQKKRKQSAQTNASGNNQGGGGGAKKYFKANDPGKVLNKKEIKQALKSGVSAKAINKYLKRNEDTRAGQNKAQGFLNKKLGKTTDITAPADEAPTTNTDPSQGSSTGNGHAPGGNTAPTAPPITRRQPGSAGGGSSDDFNAGANKGTGSSTDSANTGGKQTGSSEMGFDDIDGNNNRVSADTTNKTKIKSDVDSSQKFGKVSGQGVVNTGSMTYNVDRSSADGDNRNNTFTNNWDNSYRNKQMNVGNTYQNDYSVRINGEGGGLDNLKSAAAFTGLNNNQAARSSSTLNGMTAAGTAAMTGEMMTGASDRITDLNNNINQTPGYWGARSTQQQNFAFGDMGKFTAKDWNQAQGGKMTDWQQQLKDEKKKAEDKVSG